MLVAGKWTMNVTCGGLFVVLLLSPLQYVKFCTIDLLLIRFKEHIALPISTKILSVQSALPIDGSRGGLRMLRSPHPPLISVRAYH